MDQEARLLLYLLDQRRRGLVVLRSAHRGMVSDQDRHNDPPCRDLGVWVAQSTSPSRNHGGSVRVSVDVKHRCDGHPTPRRVEHAHFLRPAGHGQRCAHA
jgi:hypothetical protein